MLKYKEVVIMAINLKKENFNDEVMKTDKPVLIDFWASWCNPCRMLSPIIDELSGETNEKFKVAKVNVDEQPELAAQFKVMSIPTLVVMKDGKVIKQSVGVKSKAAILEMLV
jgi:thioredoxin 1